MEYSSSYDGFSNTSHGFQEFINGSSSSSLALTQNGTKEERALVALRNHSEAERRRRGRINGHLAALRSLIPHKDKMDKASLLAEVIDHLKETRGKAVEASKGVLVPMDKDEVRVEEEDGSAGGCRAIRASLCCDYKHDILSDLRQALHALQLNTVKAEIATLGGRMIYVFVISCCKEGNTDNTQGCRPLVSSIRQTLRSVLEKFYASEDISSRNMLANKRRRVTSMGSSDSYSLGDLW
ncbi:hypothetical protein NMG60_11032798 [Bertholletia excelsa]